MEYEVTEERKAYLDARGYTILSACPGSGKTTSIVKKLYDIRLTVNNSMEPILVLLVFHSRIKLVAS